MDNEAFRALVAERSKPKSTKEIAREAVEQEFRDRKSRAGGKKRRRGGGGGGGGGSSSDEDGGGGGRGGRGGDDDDDSDDGGSFDRRKGREEEGDDDHDEKEPKWKRERRAKKRAKEEAEGKVRYRDRAKERREGRTNADYAGIEEAVAAAGAGVGGGAGAGSGDGDGVAVLGGAEADMTKYLGGDESRTHLVRGLDWALAQKVRREEMGTAVGNDNVEEGGGLGGDDANLESILQSSRAEKSDSEALRRAIQNLSSASSDRNDPRDVMAILNRLQNTAQTESGGDMATFLMNKTRRNGKVETTKKKKKLTTTNAGRTLQRTKLQFSLRCHPGDVLRSWEVPREEVSSLVEHERRRQKGSDVPFGEKLTPFDQSFLTRMKVVLAPTILASSDKKVSGTTKKGRDGRKKNKHKEGGASFGEGGKDDTESSIENAGDREQSSTAATDGPPLTNDGNNDGGESSDEDIFGGIGQYQPSLPTDSKVVGSANGKVPADGKKKSIFEGLTSEPDSINKTKTSAPISNVPSFPTASEETNVIDRDVFGARPVDKRASTARPVGGVSISDYAGGYGEEMDIDFTGADDDEAAKGKKGCDDLTTTAALEYGRRSGPQSKHG